MAIVGLFLILIVACVSKYKFSDAELREQVEGELADAVQDYIFKHKTVPSTFIEIEPYLSIAAKERDWSGYKVMIIDRGSKREAYLKNELQYVVEVTVHRNGNKWFRFESDYFVTSAFEEE